MIQLFYVTVVSFACLIVNHDAANAFLTAPLSCSNKKPRTTGFITLRPKTSSSPPPSSSSSLAMPVLPTHEFSNPLEYLDKDQHPLITAISSYFLVTASDMIPFVPCQPLAIALGAKLGMAWAFPITAAGQTTAGILAFSSARKASQSQSVQEAITKVSTGDPVTYEKFQKLQQLTSEETTSRQTILAALLGLRVAPFFPFSAGNYLLGGTTSVPLSLFTVATIFGCVASNLLSTSVGAGAATAFLPIASN